jgi:hypothetical protein
MCRPGAGISEVPREAEQQCCVRDANEAIARLNAALLTASRRVAFGCECGDPACLACVSLTHAEYEAVREYGSYFAVFVPQDPSALPAELERSRVTSGLRAR